MSTGVWYPSVTTVLGTSDPEKTAKLDVWKKSVGFDKAAQRTKEATDRGTAVHDEIDQWLTSFQLTVTSDTDKIIRVPAKQIIKLLTTNLTEIWMNEQPVYSDVLRTAGRVDLVGRWNGVPAIIDFKTASRKKDEDDILQYFLQATAYSMCWYEITGELIEDIVIIIGNENLFKPQLFHRKITPYLKKVQTVFANYHAPNNRR